MLLGSRHLPLQPPWTGPPQNWYILTTFTEKLYLEGLEMLAVTSVCWLRISAGSAVRHSNKHQ
jgi:hypothetical protein